MNTLEKRREEARRRNRWSNRLDQSSMFSNYNTDNTTYGGSISGMSSNSHSSSSSSSSYDSCSSDSGSSSCD